MKKHPRWRESLRTWWHWHMERNQVHIHGVHELRRIGTVVESKGNYWRIDDEVGRSCYVVKSLATDVQLAIGDRVELEPISQGWPVDSWLWRVIRKIDQEKHAPSATTDGDV